LTSALDGGEWSASRHGLFTPKESDPDTHWIESMLEIRAGLCAFLPFSYLKKYEDWKMQNNDFLSFYVRVELDLSF
jgi:hypothetical protein